MVLAAGQTPEELDPEGILRLNIPVSPRTSVFDLFQEKS